MYLQANDNVNMRGDKFSKFITYAINCVYANSNVSFKYTILPVTYHNEEKYIGQYLFLFSRVL